jgi:hypothetical protein
MSGFSDWTKRIFRTIPRFIDGNALQESLRERRNSERERTERKREIKRADVSFFVSMLITAKLPNRFPYTK